MSISKTDTRQSKDRIAIKRNAVTTCVAVFAVLSVLSACSISTAALMPKSQDARVRVMAETNVHSGPSLDDPTIESYPKDTEVVILAKSPDGLWWQVQIENSVGWVLKADTTPITDTSKVPVLQDPALVTLSVSPSSPPEVFMPPPPPECGNYIVEPGEECDGPSTCEKGNCNPNTCKCIILADGPYCGDKIVTAGEECDGPGTCNSDFQYCDSQCSCKQIVLQPLCGNSVVDEGEECDGPGTCNSDFKYCDSYCTCQSQLYVTPQPVCGNMVWETGEECDGPQTCPNPLRCSQDCTCEGWCGNSVIEGNEECDGPGTCGEFSSCDSSCTCQSILIHPVCGNGVVEPGEACDGPGTCGMLSHCESSCTCQPNIVIPPSPN